MSPERSNQPGLDVFWEQADDESLDEHPLERELAHRLGCVARYAQMIADAEASDRVSVIDSLRRECQRHQELADALRDALRRR